MLKKIYRVLIVRMPLHAIIAFPLTILAAVVHLIAWKNALFADVFNQTISAGIRMILFYLTGWIPFSLAETMLLFLPFLLIAALISSLRIARKSWKEVWRYTIGLLALIGILYSLFVFTFASGYHTPTLDTKLEYQRQDVSALQLYESAQWLALEMEAVLDEVDFLYASHSVMDMTPQEMNRELMLAYDKLSGQYDFVTQFHSCVKRIVLSEPMTYTHVSGVYSFFTGEANINVHYPDFVIPYTAAHELAHQRGFARENEANFIAFLVCQKSDHPYIRYSGLLNMYEYVLSALSRSSSKYYQLAYQALDVRVRMELASYSEFFEPYRNSTASEISSTVNNTFLTLQGTEGTKSYGMVVDLLVAYCHYLQQ